MNKIYTYKIIFSIILLVTLFYACDSTDPVIEDNTDVATLNTKSKGFSFALGSVIPYSIPGSDSSKIIVDMQIQAIRNGITILGVYLTSPDTFITTFSLIREFNQLDSAEMYFNNLKEVPDSNYLLSADQVKINQIWAIKTSENKYAKILILDTEAYVDTIHPVGFLSFFAQTTFKWKFQQNGTRIF
jgi:hypothetical protein